MAWSQRLRMRAKNIFTRPTQDNVATGGDEEDSAASRPNRQYRLEATRRAAGKASLLRRIVTLNGLIRSLGHHSSLAAGVNPNQRLAMYLHWMFRVNFLFLFVVMCVSFFALVILFCGFIALAGTLDADCVRIGGQPFDSAGAAFADAFALSWTTMSTVRCVLIITWLLPCITNSPLFPFFSRSKVGYGSTYPAMGFQNSSPTNCFFINFICSLEALLGVLYSGFCGAILFGKVLRIQSHAQVIFSDPLLIRYGVGVLPEAPLTPAAVTAHASEDEKPILPCPVLEFRIVNRLFNEIGGEIMDASLNVVANINVNDADPALRGALNESERGSGVQETSQNSTISGDAAGDDISYQDSSRSVESGARRSLARFLTPLGFSISRHGTHVVDEDPSARFVNKHIFSKMMIEASEHPFFRRVWVARHVLDAHSPILKHKVRRQIRRNGGSWPVKLNNADAIRECLQFNQILVSLTGVSNISASDVYAQKI